MVRGNRSYIQVRPLHRSERTCAGAHFMHERYSGFVAAPHAHEELQVTVPLAGRMHLNVAGESHLIGPESVIVLPADVAHAVTYLDGELAYLVVTVTPAWLAAMAQQVGASAGDWTRPRVFADPFLWALARTVATELDAPLAGTDALLEAALVQLGVRLARVGEAAGVLPAATDAAVLRAVDRMLRAYDEELSVAELAREAAMSPRHFERRFKAALGVSPRRYLIDVRLRMAKAMLETSDSPVLDVAVAVGFNHVSHFIDSFRQAFGTTPAAHRLAQLRS